ncbi:HNH endonuclease family protein [Prauserella endophytica]|uniref:HNH endonuclease n=1 Tax=Prauserella endophytica TaxID=1592324 RepID=A0ABY2RV31_9PSEU|nr:HNH endonuclease family protein [Prauserella endophytica]TKG61573.1 HNH endonuclease [Prauserella endophytica]
MLTGCHPLTLTSAATSASEPYAVVDVREQLEQLPVGPRGSLAGYDRDEDFPHWSSQGDGCNTREVVLERDGTDVMTGPGCKSTSGTWVSPYDGQTWTDPSDVDIDHVVPLAQSWVSGARSWTQAQREAFANDLTRPQLLAVTDNVNQEKGRKAPDEWKPPLVGYWCTYASDWVTVKHHYALTITSGEKSALLLMLDKCPKGGRS